MPDGKWPPVFYGLDWGTSPMPKVLGLVFMSARSILDPVTACILEKRASRLSSFLAVAQNNANRTTSSLHSNGGKTTSRERSSRKEKKRSEYGFDARF